MRQVRVGSVVGTALAVASVVLAQGEQPPGVGATETTVEVSSAPAGAPAAPAAEVGELRTADESYEVKIKDIEEKVNELKEKIFRSKARLLALQEAVIGGVSAGSRATIIHRNEMGATFRLKEMHYFIDGAPLRQEVDDTGEALSAKEEIELFTGNIVPGNHQVTVNLVYQGHGYGVFSYLNGYTFRIKSSYTFRAEEGKESTLRIVAFEKGGPLVELKDRPTVRYDLQVTRMRARKTAEGAAATSGEGAAPAAP
ncbi:MAG: dihydrolipoamide acetyltransferase [Deltaproteobacteria bacterium]|nr:dihydrolipoamide acetyltransferase [Deltaproteobacteria bacterium]